MVEGFDDVETPGWVSGEGDGVGEVVLPGILFVEGDGFGGGVDGFPGCVGDGAVGVVVLGVLPECVCGGQA